MKAVWEPVKTPRNKLIQLVEEEMYVWNSLMSLILQNEILENTILSVTIGTPEHFKNKDKKH